MNYKPYKSTILDGSIEKQHKESLKFIASLTEDEYKRAMSDEFAYLDEDKDEIKEGK